MNHVVITIVWLEVMSHIVNKFTCDNIFYQQAP